MREGRREGRQLSLGSHLLPSMGSVSSPGQGLPTITYLHPTIATSCAQALPHSSGPSHGAVTLHTAWHCDLGCKRQPTDWRPRVPRLPASPAPRPLLLLPQNALPRLRLPQQDQERGGARKELHTGRGSRRLLRPSEARTSCCPGREEPGPVPGLPLSVASGSSPVPWLNALPGGALRIPGTPSPPSSMLLNIPESTAWMVPVFQGAEKL